MAYTVMESLRILIVFVISLGLFNIFVISVALRFL
tara:strand:+ start:2509 stop:2613 length:105 start_codon:yes stop_codon:yes gene_type:complete